ncbi:hypothetical protein CCACVL1_02314 [Corchorus capsularis]|uniref:At2g35280-like TPR domain-containing protein n=1 Tax=Corchorus capsularis TaxID=210143 RepID=A0A1R3K9C1_COCAP|nr:hypothetical protein CCACVL1_02314 [Corchorus capsularis]
MIKNEIYSNAKEVTNLSTKLGKSLIKLTPGSLLQHSNLNHINCSFFFLLSTRNKTFKQNSTETAKPTILLSDLPLEILAQILSRAASNSAEDYGNAVLSCKRAWKASTCFMIFKEVSLANIGPVPRRNVEVELVQRCAEQGNIDALFRLGLATFFQSRLCHNDAIDMLRKSYDGGHLAAGYMLRLILVICCGPDRMEEGLGLLSGFKVFLGSNLRSQVWKCRATAAGVLTNLSALFPNWAPCEEIDRQLCKNCRTNHEIIITRGVVSSPLPNTWLRPDFHDYEHPHLWQLHVRVPDPLDWAFCHRCFWITEAKFFFTYVRDRCGLDDLPFFTRLQDEFKCFW